MVIYIPPDGGAPQVSLAERRRAVLARLRRAAREGRTEAAQKSNFETASDRPEAAHDAA
jgi:hypothetical protein